MNKKFIILVAILVVAVIAIRYVTNAKPAPESAPRQSATAQAISVEAEKVIAGEIDRVIEAVGTLVSNESVVLMPEISGRITRITFDEGQSVEAGQPLVQLDDAIARAELIQAETSLTLSKTNYDRALKLFSQDAESGSTRDEALAKRNTDQAAVELARARLEKTLIVAPFDGVIGLRNVSIGDYVNPGQSLVNIESIDPLKLDFQIPELYLSAVKNSQAVDIKVDAFPDKIFSGEVYAIDPLIDSNGRTVSMRARLPNPEKLLRPGLFGRVKLVLGSNSNAILVPEEALVPEGEGVFVYKVVDGKALRTSVQTGMRRNGKVEITQGLALDDLIVTAGQMKLRPGALVKILPTTRVNTGTEK